MSSIVKQPPAKYLFAIATVYMCYFTQGVQAIIFSQNQVNFYTQWGYTDATAGAAAVSMAITWVGVGKFISVWIGGEISDRIGRKKMVVAGGICYIIAFIIMLTTDSMVVACVAGFLTGLGTSGFWDGSCYPAVAEASPRYAASTTIGIKLVISVAGIIYPIIAAINSGDSWHINIWIPIVMSIIATIMAIFTPFIYDDERKQSAGKEDGEAKNKAEAEIQAAKDAMLEKPSGLTQFVTLFFGFIIMFIMYGAQQYSKQFGITNLGLDPTAAAGLTSIYTVGSVVAVLFWAFLMGKLRWTPIKVIFIDSIMATFALVLVLAALPLNLGAGVVYVAVAILGFSAAGGMLQTGVSLRQVMCPGPRGRNLGMYYTFMGFASVFLPFMVSGMTTSVGEGSAVWIMMVLLLVASALSIVMSLVIMRAYKRQFGVSSMKRMPDNVNA
ncbi:MAG: MFS transporter [Eggerthellaceae bacterium]